MKYDLSKLAIKLPDVIDDGNVWSEEGTTFADRCKAVSMEQFAEMLNHK